MIINRVFNVVSNLAKSVYNGFLLEQRRSVVYIDHKGKFHIPEQFRTRFIRTHDNKFIHKRPKGRKLWMKGTQFKRHLTTMGEITRGSNFKNLKRGLRKSERRGRHKEYMLENIL